MSLSISELATAPVNVLTRAEVMTRWNVTGWFMRNHKTAMGGRGKPERFDALLVEEFFRGYFRDQAMKDAEKQESTDAIKRDLGITLDGFKRSSSNVRPIRAKMKAIL